MKNNKGQTGMLSVGVGAIVLVLVLILVLGVAVPLAQTVVTSANLTGMNATIANYIVTFLILGVFATVAFFAIRPLLGGSQ